ncbi:unnamed protein product [Paramecium primaurelia]|uniref:Uncharacterized protein n=1 Tax=Paramecium primaurelia TaxID=5886 RepID=A0A8S1M093_PARPR|nr:unnamed protein product [Paramecium primaurelia]
MLDDTYAEICFNYRPKKKMVTPQKQQSTFKSKQDVYDYVDKLQAQAKLPPIEHEFYLNSFRSSNSNKYKPIQCSKSVLVQKQTKNTRLNSLMSEISSTLEEGIITQQEINDSYSKEKKRLEDKESKYSKLLQNLEQKNHITNSNWKNLIKHHFRNLNEYMDYAIKDIKEEKHFVYSHQISTRHHYLFVDNEIRRNFLKRRQTKT